MNLNDYNFDRVEKPVENKTDFGKGMFYYTCDGKKVATMEDVIYYNEMYYQAMKKEHQGKHK
jgi:hypothetical protein